MPNFWTKTTQSLYEAFKGPRTVDTEYNNKVAELKGIVNQMKLISNTVKSFPQKLLGFKDFCSDICQNTLRCYPSEIIYHETITEIAEAHKKMIEKYQSCSQVLGGLSIASTEWNKIFTEVKDCIKKREEARKIHDHYDKKMEGLVQERNEKLDKNQNETNEEIKKFDRVSFNRFYIYFFLLIE